MSLRTQFQWITGSAAVVVLGAVAFGGGYYLEFGNPAASNDPAAKNALTVVRSHGCGEPWKSTVTATAEGLVDGKRKSAPLEVVALSTPGAFAVKGTVPAEGVWIVTATGRYEDAQTAAMAPIAANKLERTSAKYVRGAPASGDIDQMLQSMAQPQGRTLRAEY